MLQNIVVNHYYLREKREFRLPKQVEIVILFGHSVQKVDHQTDGSSLIFKSKDLIYNMRRVAGRRKDN